MALDAVFGPRMFRNDIIWCYSGGGVPKSDYPRKHDVIFRYTKTDDYVFNTEYRDYGRHNDTGRRATDLGGSRKVEYNPEGTPVNDWWDDIPPLINWHSERSGYPTQKPVLLYERIVAASSNRGDWVMDPFAGSGTTLMAADVQGRKWVGMDANPNCEAHMLNRWLPAFTREPAIDQIAFDDGGSPDASQLADARRVAHELGFVSTTELPEYSINEIQR